MSNLAEIDIISSKILWKMKQKVKAQQVKKQAIINFYIIIWGNNFLWEKKNPFFRILNTK